MEDVQHQMAATNSGAASPTPHAELTSDDLQPSQDPATQQSSPTAVVGCTASPPPVPPTAAENRLASPTATEQLLPASPAAEEQQQHAGVLEQELAAPSFIDTITHPIEQPLLHTCQQNQVKPRRTRKPPGKPTRRSARLAAIAWPMGDAQSRAQQILLKRLAIAQEGGCQDQEELQRFINMFKGPLSSLVIKALEALSGLDGPALLRQINA